VNKANPSLMVQEPCRYLCLTTIQSNYSTKQRQHKEKGLAMNEFHRTLTTIVEKRGMSVADLAERTGYTPLFFESIITGKNRQMPVDFFLRVAQTLDLSEEEKDALVCSWAFGRA
jgi:predicted transcriptional regulator